ncbi:hypothetical protein [Rhizobium lusitanum]|uniref:Uncharacterized protein n=1 Tax=Rhizobium lusitanum TaxID=293958 RepID=A0A1C3VS93_9HYPH|nr:hypothetical protein [Rhizobium lusitanum]SCB30569.1 hypothetical protein GA0061101_106126 [Rhizobium lusitanum]
MNTKEIQKRLDQLMKAMIDKGLKQPCAQFDAESGNIEFRVYLRWQDPTKLGKDRYSDGLFKFIKNDDPGKAFEEADEFVAAMPSGDEARLHQFMGALATVIDLGKDNGIEVEFMNPLQATMKKLSENILTDQRAA